MGEVVPDRTDTGQHRCRICRSNRSSTAQQGAVAQRWRYRDGSGEFGTISSVTRAFCGDCTRARLSTEGLLYLCLFAQQGHDLRALLRSGADDQQIAAAIGALWAPAR